MRAGSSAPEVIASCHRLIRCQVTVIVMFPTTHAGVLLQARVCPLHFDVASPLDVARGLFSANP